MPTRDPFIPKTYDGYYSMGVDHKIKYKQNTFSKEDLFNIMNGICYHTELECEADRDRILKILNDYIVNTKEYIEAIKNKNVK